MRAQVQEVSDGDSGHGKILEALHRAKNNTRMPSIIIVTTTIGFGSAKQGTEKVHGAPLAADDLKAARVQFGFDPDRSFEVPEEVATFYRMRKEDGDAKYNDWCAVFKSFEEKFPEESAEIRRRFAQKLPEGWKEKLPRYTPESKAEATRNYSGKALSALFDALPEIVGGSADLAGKKGIYIYIQRRCNQPFASESNQTVLQGGGEFQNDPAGRYIRSVPSAVPRLFSLF